MAQKGAAEIGRRGFWDSGSLRIAQESQCISQIKGNEKTISFAGSLKHGEGTFPHSGNHHVESLEVEVRRERPRRNTQGHVGLSFPLDLEVRQREGKGQRMAAVAEYARNLRHGGIERTCFILLKFRSLQDRHDQLPWHQGVDPGAIVGVFEGGAARGLYCWKDGLVLEASVSAA